MVYKISYNSIKTYNHYKKIIHLYQSKSSLNFQLTQLIHLKILFKSLFLLLNSHSFSLHPSKNSFQIKELLKPLLLYPNETSKGSDTIISYNFLNTPKLPPTPCYFLLKLYKVIYSLPVKVLLKDSYSSSKK